MAKPGGKSGGKHKGKRADQDKDKKRAKPGKAPKSGRPGKGAGLAGKGGAAAAGSRVGKSKLGKGATQLLVERVAEEIVIAEYDRAVNGAAVDAMAREAEAGAGVGTEADAGAGAEAEAPARGKGGAKAKAKGKVKNGVGAEAEVGSDAGPAVEVGGDAAAEAGAGVEVGSGVVGAAEGDEGAGGAFSELLRLPVGPVDLAAIETDATPGVSSRDKAEGQLPKLAERLNELQERLFAAARGGESNRRVLLVLQGMDTSGKGGTVRHVVGQLDPNGIRVTAFKAPTAEERAHDFLWRIRNAVPQAGEVGIFDRSHYEDVLIARVHKLALPMVIGKRYQLINRFEQSLVADGAVLVKCFLHISPDEQRKRLLTRLDDPNKHWKYNPTDVDERALWPQYQEAYRLALEKCSTEHAPWYVIPADHKWYRNYAITRLLLEALERINPVYPPGAFDVEVERKRLLGG